MTTRKPDRPSMLPAHHKSSGTAARLASSAADPKAAPREKKGRKKRDDLWRTNLGLSLEQKKQLEQLSDRVHAVTKRRPAFAEIVRGILAAGLPAAAKLDLDGLKETSGMHTDDAALALEEWFRAQLVARR